MLAMCERLGARTPELSQALGDLALAWPRDQKSQRFVFLHLPVIKDRTIPGVRAPPPSTPASAPGAPESNFNWSLHLAIWSIRVELSLLDKHSAVALYPQTEPAAFWSCCDCKELLPRTFYLNFSFLM